MIARIALLLAALAIATPAEGAIRLTQTSRGPCSFSLVDGQGRPILYPSGGTSRLGVIIDGRFHSIAGGGRGMRRTRLNASGFRCERTIGGVNAWVDVTLEGDRATFRVGAKNRLLIGRQVGLLAYLDTQLGRNDGSPLYVDDESRLYLAEREYVGVVPETWRSFDRHPNPRVKSLAVYHDRPDRLAFLFWPASNRSPLQYQVSPGKVFSRDSATRAIWSPSTLGRSQSREVVFTYGSGEAGPGPWRTGLAAAIRRVSRAYHALLDAQADATARLIDRLTLEALKKLEDAGKIGPGSASTISVEVVKGAIVTWKAGLKAGLKHAGPGLAFWAIETVLEGQRAQKLEDRYLALIDVVQRAKWAPGQDEATRLDRLRGSLAAEVGLDLRRQQTTKALAALATGISGRAGPEPPRAQTLITALDVMSDDLNAAIGGERVLFVPDQPNGRQELRVVGEPRALALAARVYSNRADNVETASMVVTVVSVGVGLIKIVAAIGSHGASLVGEGMLATGGAFALGAGGVALKAESVSLEGRLARLAVLAERSLARELQETAGLGASIETLVQAELQRSEPAPFPKVDVTMTLVQPGFIVFQDTRPRHTALRISLSSPGGAPLPRMAMAAVVYDELDGDGRPVAWVPVDTTALETTGGTLDVPLSVQVPAPATFGGDMRVRIRVLLSLGVYHRVTSDLVVHRAELQHHKALGQAPVRVETAWSGPVAQGQKVSHPVPPANGGVQWLHLSYGGSDIDLHVYAPDGRHAGRSYTRGRVENQIPGVTAFATDSHAHERIRIDAARAPSGLRYEVVGVRLRSPERVEIVSERWKPSVPALVALSPDSVVLSGGRSAPTRLELLAREVTCTADAGALQVRASGSEGVTVVPTQVTLPSCGRAAIQVSLPEGDGVGATVELVDAQGKVRAQARIGASAGSEPDAPKSEDAWGGKSRRGSGTIALVVGLIVLLIGGVIAFAFFGSTSSRSEAPAAGGCAVTVTPPSGPGWRLTLPALECTVGRAPGNVVVIEDDHISRHHLTVSWDASRLSVLNATSPERTLLDGNPLPTGAEVQIESGATLRLAGGTLLKIERA